MTSLEAAWLAAAVDADGSIGLYQKADGRKVNVALANTCLAYVERARELTGVGSIQSRMPTTTLGAKKRLYYWRISSARQALVVIAEMLPYLIVKREKAESILAAIALKPLGHRGAEDRARIADKVRSSWADPAVRAARLAGMRRVG